LISEAAFSVKVTAIMSFLLGIPNLPNHV